MERPEQHNQLKTIQHPGVGLGLGGFGTKDLGLGPGNIGF